MTRRERVRRAMHYQAVDKAPLQYYYCPVGYYEHGDKLNDLYQTLPGDFEPFVRKQSSGPAPDEVDENGRYHAVHIDAWGIPWEYRIFGVTGIPKYPILEDDEAAGKYLPPAPPACSGADFEAYKAHIQAKKDADYYALEGCGNLYEKMIALCGDENVLCGMQLDEPGINALADRIIEYDAALLKRAMLAGADSLSFGDDYGTERAMIMSPACWRRFIKPRLRQLFEPAVKAGMDIHFHSCGQVADILPDLREIGVTSIWPQLPAYNMEQLAKCCRDLQLAVAIHTDRANTMTFGTPQQVRDLVRREFDTFRMMDGGSWFYVEADNDFPFENLKALVETIALWR